MKKWADLKHPNVLEIFGISSDGADPLYMITPYQSCGNVRQFLRRNPSADRPKLVLDVALGMQFIHSVSDIPECYLVPYIV
ncbi:hypothetical protein C8J56DRAFT_558457 [Mycena floridula]|nr:hypothetical protein C8J56DRAFT_558457 [Mycena floridula]